MSFNSHNVSVRVSKAITFQVECTRWPKGVKEDCISQDSFQEQVIEDPQNGLGKHGMFNALCETSMSKLMSAKADMSLGSSR